MIINLWSTPRTGSVWYSHYLRTQYPNSILLTEMFNRYHMNLYYSVKGGLKNFHHYEPGFFYKDYRTDSGNITSRKVFSERTRTVDEEEQYLISLFDNFSNEQTLVMHNHVEPMNPVVRDYLLGYPNSKNIFIYRKDKRAQLASYAIATATRQFAVFDKNVLSDTVVPDINPLPLQGLIERIKVWDSLDKSETIAYEDIQFVDIPGSPLKQNTDYRIRLSDKMLTLIDTLVSEYENN